jgi:L-fuculose-phosphate aldolase
MRIDEDKIREQICDIGRRVWQRGYVAANDGNFSVRVAENRFIATPTMLSKGFMTPDDLVVLDGEGRQIGGHRTPTSETKIHLDIYRKRPDVNAVVHAHPPYATAFAVAQLPVPKCVLPEVEIFLGEIPIAEYATPGTQSFADSIDPYIRDFNLFLLANHGALAIGEDLTQAYYRMEIVDQYCRILLYTRQLGDYRQITQDKMQDLFQLKERLGFRDRRLQPGGNVSCGIPSPVTGGDTYANPLNEAESSSGLTERIRGIVQRVLKEHGK